MRSQEAVPVAAEIQEIESEAELASAAEASFSRTLNEVQSQASGQSIAIALQALEREAKASRDLLQSYLARYGDASAPEDLDGVPSKATIVSRVDASIKPSLPKHGPMSTLAVGTTALFGQRRAALQIRPPAKDARRSEAAAARLKGRTRARVGPVLKSFDALLNQVRAGSAGIAPRSVLVAPVSTGVDATDEAIRIARALVSGKHRVVLVDLARGAAAVSGRLGLPRAPGFTDLAAGRADFEDVVYLDEETPLQIIPAGNPTVKGDGNETKRIADILEALAQAYDCLVLHGDRATASMFEPLLEGRLQVVVAVLAPGESAKGEDRSLAEFAAFGCSVVPYAQAEAECRSRRSGLFGHAAPI